jgi:hypothetical protein
MAGWRPGGYVRCMSTGTPLPVALWDRQSPQAQAFIQVLLAQVGQLQVQVHSLQ